MKNHGIPVNYSVYIILAIIILYSYSITFPYLPLDDTDIIQSRLHYFGDFRNALDILITPLYKNFVTSLYRPILYLTFMIDTILGSGSPITFHVSNIFYHILATILLYKYFNYFIPSNRIVFILTTFFAIHPIHVHAVAWISGRNDILLAIILLLIFISYNAIVISSNRKYIIAHFLLIFTSFFVKETAIVIPVLLFIYTGWVNPAGNKLKVFIPGWILSSVIAVIIRSFVVKGALPLKFTGIFNTVQEFSIVFINYFGKLFIPVNYSVLPTVSDMVLLPGLTAMFIFILLSIMLEKKNNKLFWFGILWYALFLSPTILWGIWSRIDEFYEHRSYIPLIGILISISQLKLSGILNISQIVKNLIIWSFCIIMFISSVDRIIRYKNPVLFTDSAVKESPSLARSHSMRGNVYKNLGDYELALSEYGKALKIKPGIPWVYSDCGQIKLNQGRYDQAIELFSIAIEMYKTDGNAYFNRAIAYVIKKEIPLAIEDFNHAITLEPDNADYYYNRGLAYESIGEYGKALQDYQYAEILLPNDETLIENINKIKSMNTIHN